MKKIITALAIAALSAAPALGHTTHHGKAKAWHAAKAHSIHARGAHAQGTANAYGRVGLDDAGLATVTERNSRGRATKVTVEGHEYMVCEGAVVDACINPRAAGLNFGNVPLDHWPGKPASEM